MADTIIQDIVTSFDTATSTFLASSAGVVSSYILPIAWMLLATTLLLYCYALQTGKATPNISHLIWNYVLAIIVLWLMSGGYVEYVAEPIMDIGDSLATGLSGGGNAIDGLSTLNTRIIDLMSGIFGGVKKLISLLDFGSAILLMVLGFLAFIASYALLGVALFFIIFVELGLVLVLSVGPFFLFALLNEKIRNYFYPWLNTALYFVFYKILTILFINLFLGILTQYIEQLHASLGDGTFSVSAIVVNMMTGASVVNVVAAIAPIILISMAMFFMLLQLPTIASSMTSGSGGAFGNGLYAMSQIVRRRGGGSSGASTSRNRLTLQPR